MTSVQANAVGPAPSRHFFKCALAVFALGLIVRAIHLWQIRAAPMFGLKIGDSLIYDVWARQIVSGEVSTEVYWYAPLYPYFLAGIYKLFGDAPMTPLAVQAVIGSLSCVILADAGRRLISPRVGIVAGAILAVYAPAIFYDGILHKPVLVLFLLCLVLWLWTARLREPGTLASWLWTGVALGLLVLARQNILAFFPVMLLWIFVERRVSLRRRALLALVFMVGLALPLLPVAARNKIVGGEFHLTAANFGDNFYKGNNEQADGTYMALPGGRPDPRFERHDATEIAQRAMGRELTPAEISNYWTRRSLEYIADRPGHWLKLMAIKSFLTWNAIEIGDVEDPYTYAEWSTPLRLTMPILHFGIIAPLAVVGLFATWKRRHVLWPVHLMIAIYAATVVMFYVFGRYRYPLVPLMALFAAAGLTQGIRYFRTSSRRQIAACCTATLAMLVLANWPTGLKSNVLLTTQRNLGATLHDEGRLEEAVVFYARALEITPHFVPLRLRLADAMIVLAEGEDPTSRRALLDEAISHYRQALAISRNGPSAHHGLAIALRSIGELDEAMVHFRMAFRFAPAGQKTQYGLDLARALTVYPNVRPVELDQAVELIEKLAESTQRSDPDLLDALAAVHAAAGRCDVAATTARQALTVTDNEDQENMIRQRLALYEQGPPCGPEPAFRSGEVRTEG